MRHIALLLGAAGFLSAQTLTEFGAAAAGSTVGGAAGKKVSDGITNVFGKVDQQTSAAAGKAKSAPTAATELEVGPGAPKSTSMGPATASAEPANGSTAVKAAVRPAARKSPGKTPDKNADNSLVPPPPPSPADRKPVEPVRERAAVVAPAPVAPAPVAPPPPEVTLDDLKQVAVGEQRDELLKLGPPSARISMWDDDHLLEIFSYRAKELMLGHVRLHDGVVDSVELR